MKGRAMAKATGCRSLKMLSLLVLAAGLILPGAVRAQITGATANTSGSTGNSGDGDGSTRSSVSVPTNNGTTLATRFAWNVTADTGVFSTRDQSGSAAHHVNFTATAVGGYRLDITTSRNGALRRSADAPGCEGQAHATGISGSSNIALNSGNLNIAANVDIGNGGGNTDANVTGSSTPATIFRASNGVGQAHSLTFTWSGSVRSNSCEAAVRLGEQSSVSGCASCVYPGDPSRNQALDGHFVTITYTSLCGNGSIDGAAGEACDQGSANGALTSCCTSNCQFRAAGQVCRGAADLCDQQETCTGSSGTCPTDIPRPSGFVCRPSAGDCDPQETCNGSSFACPADAKSSSVCRPSAGSCDVAESCNGVINNCPADGFLGTSSVCRPAVGTCDVAENCTGSGPACPADVLVPSGTSCRASAGPCDIAETCNGVSGACPANAFEPNTTECRASAGDCDIAENCTGSGAACPADAFQPNTVECRASAGVCDIAENCTGSSANCPADSVQGAFVECRPSTGPCDPAENCTGSGVNCPADALSPSGTVCRASAGVCDVAETCDGATAGCPANGFAPSSTTCRPSVGTCDVAENCTGSGAACPADGFQPTGTSCRAAAGQCDVAEVCTGLSGTCPADLTLPNGTPCDDTNTCTSPDTCQAGICVGTPLTTCNDHYLCYKTKRQSVFTPALNVRLVDQFEDIRVDVKQLKDICTPADKNGEGVIDAVTHVNSYSMKARTGTPRFVRRTNVRVDNQLIGSPFFIDVFKRDLLLVPSNKNLSGPTTPPTTNVDHYKCYKAKTSAGRPRFQAQNVTVVDQFTGPSGKQFTLKKLRQFCTPVDKNGEGITNPDAHLACYQANSVRGQPRHVRRTGVNTNNQFGPLVLGTVRENMLCIPSTKTLTP